MPSLWAKTRTTPEKIKWEHSIFSSVVWLCSRPDGRDARYFFFTGNGW